MQSTLRTDFSKLFLAFRKRSSAVLLMVVAVIFYADAAGLVQVRNFTREEYGAGRQNWDIVQDSLGRIYVGNSDGMMRFDGARWTHHRLPNFSTVRSLLYDGPTARIYAGGSEEFGFFTPDSTGRALRYVSLLPTIPRTDRHFTEVWHIFRAGDKVWFQTDFSLFRYDGASTVAFPASGRITTSSIINNTIYVALDSGEIMRFNGSFYEPVQPASVLGGARVVALLDYNDRDIMVVTAEAGLWILNQSGMSPFHSDLDPFLLSNRVFCARTQKDWVVFGTVTAGAVMKNFRTGATNYIGRLNGMQNSTVLNLNFDRIGNLWLCLDDGLDYANCTSPVRNLISRRNECGAGYASALYQGRLYLGTNQGVYSTAHPIAETGALPLHEFGGQVWGLSVLDGYLFASTDTGLFYRSPGSSAFKRVAGIAGTNHVELVPGHPGCAIASTYHNLHLLRHEGDAWTDAGEIMGYDGISGRFVIDKRGDMWLAHWRKGVFRLSFNKDLTKVSRTTLFDSRRGLPLDENNTVTLIDGEPVIATEKGFYTLNPRTSRMERSENLSRMINLRGAGHLFPFADAGLVAISASDFVLASRDINGGYEVDSLSFRTIASHIIPGFGHINRLSPREILVSNQEGFWVIDPETRHTDKWTPPLFVSSITADRDSVLYLACGTKDIAATNPKIPSGHSALRFEFGYPEFRQAKSVLFSTLLEGHDRDWTPYSDEAFREFSHLPEGRYRLRIRVHNLYSGARAECEFQFRVLPPWWRTSYAWIVYTTLIAVAIWFIWKRLDSNARRAEERMEREKQKEMDELRRIKDQENLRKDHEIALLKSEQLEHDVRHKSEELSSVTMSLIRKNEILHEISSKVQQIAEHPDMENVNDRLKRRLDSLQSSIRESIDRDDDWKTFNRNFNIVYKDYTDRLISLHPSLRQGDIRMCCYIKMGLTSKEIAPLVNISPRSVEMTRYRLRKKMELDSTVSLTDYLQSI